MKRLFVLFLALCLIALSGCQHSLRYANCESIDELDEFANTYPNSKHAWNAKARAFELYMCDYFITSTEIRDQEWDDTIEKDSAHKYRWFAQEYPGSPFETMALMRAQTLDERTQIEEEDSVLNLIYQNPSMDRFESFLDDYPNSRRRKEVISCMDELAHWEAAELGLDFWQEYLMAYPHGLMAKNAEKGIHDREIEKLLAGKKPGQLPETDPEFTDWLPQGTAMVILHNDCSSDLSLYYQSHENTYKWILAPQDTLVDWVTPSKYRVVASVNERDVTNYEGSVELQSSELLTVLYYIRQQRFGMDFSSYRPNPITTEKELENLIRLINEELEKNNHPILSREY